MKKIVGALIASAILSGCLWVSGLHAGWCLMTETSKYGMDDGKVDWKSDGLTPGTTIQSFHGAPVRTKKTTLEMEYFEDASALRRNEGVSSGFYVTSWGGSRISDEVKDKTENKVKLLQVENKQQCEGATLHTFAQTKE